MHLGAGLEQSIQEFFPPRALDEPRRPGCLDELASCVDSFADESATLGHHLLASVTLGGTLEAAHERILGRADCLASVGGTDEIGRWQAIADVEIFQLSPVASPPP